MSANNGGPAFPIPGLHDDADFNGMALRDYFAAKAMQALIGKEDKDFSNRGAKAVPLMARWAYEYADAMIAAREAK